MSAGVREKRMSFWEVSMSAVLLSASITGYTEQLNENIMKTMKPRKPTCPPDVRGLNHVHALFSQIFTAASGFQLLAGVFARYSARTLPSCAARKNPLATGNPISSFLRVRCFSNDDSSIIVSQHDSNLLSGKEKVAVIWTYPFFFKNTPNTYEELRDLKWTYR